MPHVIAIDGPAGAGKSTIARRLARRLNYIYIDSGAMYRAVALWSLRESARQVEELAEAAEIELGADGSVWLNGEDITQLIRTPEISATASRVAAIGKVRHELVAKQRAMGQRSGVVMEGRDIGSVVFPDAEVKIFLDANQSERVRRRAGEQPRISAEQISAQIRERDERDRGRAESPLVQAPGAVYVDSTGMNEQQVEDLILEIIAERISQV